MKNTINSNHLVTLLFSFCFVFWGCDYIEFPIQAGPNGCEATPPAFTPSANPQTKVLVEDFTGHRCGNCPKGGEAAHNLIQQYGDRVVVIANISTNSPVFTAPLTTDPQVNPTMKYTYDFRTNWATEIDNEFGNSKAGLPNGMVNRKPDAGNSRILLPSKWQSQVADLLSKPIVFDIQLKSFYNATKQTVCSYAFVDVQQDIAGKFNIVIVLTEDKFINWQKYYNHTPEDEPNYEHNHILRAAFNGTFGTPISSASAYTAGETFTLGFSIDFNAGEWDAANCNIVAYIINADTHEVLQAEQIKML